MPTAIWFENKFGEKELAGVRILISGVDSDLYEVLAIRSPICADEANLAELCSALNIDKREGYNIYPLKDSLDQYVWYHHDEDLVLCLARGLWG